MTDSQNLLAEFRQTGSDAAFRELVTRYVDLVYSTALRLVDGDAHRAQDVAQTVFVNLSHKARTLPADVSLGGWLHRDTCLTAGHVMRGERRRQSRERQAAEMNALQNHSQADYSLVAPLLDEAINELGEADRTAILLRFFEQHDFRAVGRELGSNEDAARMRVNRALEKLEEFLKRRGITTTAASLGVVLTANAVQAAPVGLAITISTAAALAGTTLATATTATAIKTIAMTTLQKTVITATLAVVAGVGIYEACQNSQLREQVQTLQQQQGPLAEQIQQLLRSHDEATNRLAALHADNERLNRNTDEMLRLRGEVALLKRELSDAARTMVRPTEQVSATRPRSTWKLREPRKLTDFQDVGSETPEATVETILWAAQNNSPNLLGMIHLPEELLSKAKTDGQTDTLTRQLADRLIEQASNVAKDDEQHVWIDGGIEADTTTITLNGTNNYAKVINFNLSGRRNLDDSSTEHYNHLLLAKIDGLWRLVIPGLSPDINKNETYQTDHN